MARNATRKNRKNGEMMNMAPAERQMGGKRKAKASRKGKKRTLSPALKEWNEKVMGIYREMKKKNPNTRLVDAMKEAKKRS